MHTGQSNIVQAEFSFVPSNAQSLEDVMAAVRDRLRDSRIKTVVRFPDLDGSITKFVQRFENVKHAHSALIRTFSYRRRIGRFFANRRSRHLAGEILAMKEKGLSRAIEALQHVANESPEIAMEEYPGARFRYVREEDLNELLESVKKATGVWFFVFTPNDLLADSNESVATMM